MQIFIKISHQSKILQSAESAPSVNPLIPGAVQELKSEGEKKAEEIERLRAAEKFMRKGTGEGECRACGYEYSPKTGDDEYPIPKGTRFEVPHPLFPSSLRSASVLEGQGCSSWVTLL